MKIKKLINFTIIILCLCLVVGVGTFIYNTISSYEISNDFVSVPLQFNPDDSSSTYQMKNAQVTVYGGFVKGIQKGKNGTESLVIRALSPLPTIQVKGSNAADILLLIENINPDFYVKSISGNNQPMTKETVNTLQLSIAVSAEKTIKIEPVQPSDADNTGKYKYIILGDNRDGYDTFEQIIQQINGENPVFVIDNGDLVFSGKPNQYRLFDQTVSKVSTTLSTTLGNHDIRGNGRSTYTMLYGPAYYSFDFTDSHFAFLDSSPGWSEKQAITDEQYTWLEKDLKKAQGKRIFVITHIPPHDPRSGVTANEIPNYVNAVKSGENWAEQKLDNYNESKDMEHGFQDPQEAVKFEKLMSSYHVDTVYLSHIHSYLEYTKDGVRYLISGGAGAELLTKNSYYHYMIAKINDVNTATIVELPSPANNYLTRYGATVQLFAIAMYEENPVAVVLVIAGFVLLIFLLIVKVYLRKKQPIDTLWKWLSDIGKYAVKRFKELFGNRSKN
ncbi:metallophosphoesterase [Desulfosporosinus sp. BICA1-9]|uniref:metallophosphoesterase family protein n=1 Tax=Desulfosporosinus sp. BICA1-9 TaxID=1531958 RepID=UPI00054B5511|nr:metallophosphoesterase [Desulfosporosinus sp. BICA1-9]KJS81092.1 MAG: metallophosphoesterase [Desulfosporosinus sp. BICA1-9]HBW35834.1 metallophosphoesterase [Desulfosporosinus sp.]